MSHESADKATAHETYTPAVDYFYSAATRRYRGALWTIFAPAFSEGIVLRARSGKLFEQSRANVTGEENLDNWVFTRDRFSSHDISEWVRILRGSIIVTYSLILRLY